ncbi:dual OB domain-containing protein [Mycobacterium conspicuum]|uniref:dual OB domain-containing protein n=1 Tax=Mycobacterium conspicuum TaxID=44010 RepID=UPI00355736D7
MCLANSRKMSGRCVAGIVVAHDRAKWIRPISSRPNHEVSEYERQYEDGSDPQVLDIVSVPLIEARPHSYQSENWLLDPEYYWKKTGRAEWDRLLAFEERPASLWINGYSTYHGVNDRVPERQARTLTHSLKLIRVDRVTLRVHCPGAAFGNPKRVVQAGFEYSGCDYSLRVTDPVYERKYLAESDGNYTLGEAFLTISLGEPYDGYVYKLVAAIIERATSTGSGR